MAGRSHTRLLLVFLTVAFPASFRGQDTATSSAKQSAPWVESRFVSADLPDFARNTGPWADPFPDPTAGKRIPARTFEAVVGKGPVAMPVTSPLAQITRAAGTIFSGRVTAVVPLAASGAQSVKTIAITFHVEHAIRGVSVGEDLTIHEWMGLWTSGERYRVGERVLLFLFPPSKLGLTSPVGGPMGRFAVDASGHILTGSRIGELSADLRFAEDSRLDYRSFASAIRELSKTGSRQ